MANKKAPLSKPSRSTSKMNFKVRFNFANKNFIVTNRKRKQMGAKTFNNHDSALVFAKELNSK